MGRLALPRKKRRERQLLPPDNVRHPRYGALPIQSGSQVDLETLRDSYWGYRTEKIYPESAIRADTSRQNYAVFPRQYYVDIQKHCRECRRPFIFFAKEQQHWYEVLGFYIDSDCVRCSECRKDDRKLKEHRAAFSKFMPGNPVRARDLASLLEAGVYLWRAGELKNAHTLSRLRNLAHAEVKSLPVTRELDALVAAIE